MSKVTFEVTLEFDEPVNSGKIHSYFYEAMEEARKNGLLSNSDIVACIDIESHVVGEEQ